MRDYFHTHYLQIGWWCAADGTSNNRSGQFTTAVLAAAAATAFTATTAATATATTATSHDAAAAVEAAVPINVETET